MPTPISIRLASAHSKEAQQFTPPTNEWMKGTWYVTHSSLPLWKDKRNVNITYELHPAGSDGVVKVDDLVKYQGMGLEKVKTVHGLDTPSPGNPGAWDWRGRGWLIIASSHWECLGFGDIQDNRWMVVYFAKTLFTPAGIDIYSRKKEGLPEATLAEIMKTLKELDAEEMKKLANSAFEIPRD